MDASAPIASSMLIVSSLYGLSHLAKKYRMLNVTTQR